MPEPSPHPAVAAAVAAVALWTSAAPSLTYPLYEEDWGLTPVVTTAIFAVHPIVLVVMLIVLGNLSDFIGLRRTILLGVERLAGRSAALRRRPRRGLGARAAFDEHVWLMIELSQLALSYLAPAGSLVFLSGTAARRPGVGLTIPAAISAGLVAATANLAVELAPRRINLVAAGFVDTPLSASLLGDDLEWRRQELRDELPIRRVVQASDVAALALHLMTNTAITGATYDIDGGQHLP